ncbi:MAG: hypothetical protein J7J03_02970, partial [Methanosarcinales archaeon]|nr:hypothetical protein [Methanosarcinales archaeon]
FEGMLTIAGLFAIAYIMRRQGQA